LWMQGSSIFPRRLSEHRMCHSLVF